MRPANYEARPPPSADAAELRGEGGGAIARVLADEGVDLRHERRTDHLTFERAVQNGIGDPALLRELGRAHASLDQRGGEKRLSGEGLACYHGSGLGDGKKVTARMYTPAAHRVKSQYPACAMSLSDRARLARNLRIARLAAGISQTAAGEAVGKTRGTIVNWENPENAAEPDSDEVATLATLYRLSAMDLRFANLVRPSAAVVAPPVIPEVTTYDKEEMDAAARQAENDRAAIAAKRAPRKRPKAGGDR